MSLSLDGANYFGAAPRVPGMLDGGRGEAPFDSRDDDQLDFGVEYTEDTRKPAGLPEEYTRGNVPRGAWVQVDLGAIAHNVRLAREAIGPRRELVAVVKADAYGHGAVRVSRAALEAGADRLAVATVEEGVELREAGISAPLLLLSQPPARTIPLLLDHHIVPSVYTSEFALELGEYADRRGEVAPFHLAVDTGMTRIGVFYLDVVDFVHEIDFHRGLKLEGTFTHFATADEESDWDFRIQLGRFEEALSLLREADIDPGVVHAANSAAIFRYPEAHFDMVRLGASLYGFSPASFMRGQLDLRQAMSVVAQVSSVKEPQMGEGVSYGLRYRVARQVQVATVPLGYADGVRRSLSGEFEVLCNGRVCRQIGTVCMDQMMLEVPLGRSVRGQAGGAEVGDEVVILGRQGDYEITIDAMADRLGTIDHEVTCLFGLRLPKVYV